MNKSKLLNLAPMAIITVLLIALLHRTFSRRGEQEQQQASRPHSEAGKSTLGDAVQKSPRPGRIKTAPREAQPNAAPRSSWSRLPPGSRREARSPEQQQAYYEAAVTAATQSDDVGDRQYALRSVADSISDDDLDRALDLLQSINRWEDKIYFAQSVVSRLAAVAPDEAAALVDRLKGQKRLKELLYGEIGRQWARSDVDGALGWLEQLPPDKLRFRAIEGIVGTWLASDRKAAAQWLGGIVDVRDLRGISETVGDTWARVDRQGAYQWAAGMQDGRARSTALVSIAAAWAREEPSAAAAWAAEFPSGNGRMNAMVSTAVIYAQKDPEGAADWFQGLPNDREKTNSFMSAAAAWGMKDAAAAADWVESVNDGSLQVAALRIVLENWARNDKDAAIDWTCESTLTEEIKELLLKPYE